MRDKKAQRGGYFKEGGLYCPVGDGRSILKIRYREGYTALNEAFEWERVRDLRSGGFAYDPNEATRVRWKREDLLEEACAYSQQVSSVPLSPKEARSRFKRTTQSNSELSKDAK